MIKIFTIAIIIFNGDSADNDDIEACIIKEEEKADDSDQVQENHVELFLADGAVFQFLGQLHHLKDHYYVLQVRDEQPAQVVN